MSIKTSGELRGFLADILVGIRDGKVDVEEANAIAKVAGQINQSLAVEVKAAVEMQRLGKDAAAAGTMKIADDTQAALAAPEEKWCDQCDKLVSHERARNCTSKFCKVRGTLK